MLVEVLVHIMPKKHLFLIIPLAELQEKELLQFFAKELGFDF